MARLEKHLHIVVAAPVGVGVAAAKRASVAAPISVGVTASKRASIVAPVGAGVAADTALSVTITVHPTNGKLCDLKL